MTASAVCAAMLLNGCSGEPSAGQLRFGYAETVQSLVEIGASIEEVGTADGTPFSVEAHHVIVDGQSTWVYEYSTADERERDSVTIAMEGWSVNNSPIEWIATPHYWLHGRVIVVYVGDDDAVIALLTEALGSQLDLSTL